MCVYSSASVVSSYLQSYELEPTRLLCPWDSPGKHTGVGHHALLQGIFPTQDPTRSPALQADSLVSEPPGEPKVLMGKRVNVEKF